MSSKEAPTKGRIRFLIYTMIIVLTAFLVSIVMILTREDPEDIYRRNSNLRIEVLNGCGVDRMAIKVTNQLRKQGFNVVRVGDAVKHDFEETVIIERCDEEMKNARYFARYYRCRNVSKDIDPALYLEITVIIGKDYKKIFKNVDKEF